MSNQFEQDTKALQTRVDQIPEIINETQLAGAQVIQDSVQALIRGVKSVLEPRKQETYKLYKEADKELKDTLAPLEAIKGTIKQKKLEYGEKVEAERQRKLKEIEDAQAVEAKRIEDERVAKAKRLNDIAEAARAKGNEERAAKIEEKIKEVETAPVEVVATPKVEIPPEPTVKYRTISTAIVEDPDQVPKEYWVIDQQALNQAARVSIDHRKPIPGVRFNDERRPY